MTLQEHQEQQQLEKYLWDLVETVLKKNGAIITGMCFTVKETAKHLKIHHTTVRRMIAEGRIKGYQVGGRILVDRSSLQTYLDSVQITPSQTQPDIANLCNRVENEAVAA